MSTAEIIDQLKLATTDLFWMSESDYPFEIVSWVKGTESDPNELFKNLTLTDLSNGLPSEPAIKSSSITNFFAPALVILDWYTAEELALVDRYQVLLRTIESNLTEVKVFRIARMAQGQDLCAEIDVYIVGKTPDGDILGLKTKVIET